MTNFPWLGRNAVRNETYLKEFKSLENFKFWFKY